MTQPNFRDMVGMVSFWATAAKDHLDYEVKHGKPPLYPVLVCPFSQLLSVALMTLGFADSHWPTGVPGSKVHNDLFAMLRPIAKHGGRSATIPDLTRIAELVESILDGKALEAKEAQGAVDSAGKIPNKGGRPKITLSVGVFVDAVTEDTRRRYWTQTQWATHFKCSHQTIGRSPGWEEIQKTWNEESSSVVQADLLDGQ